MTNNEHILERKIKTHTVREEYWKEKKMFNLNLFVLGVIWNYDNRYAFPPVHENLISKEKMKDVNRIEESICACLWTFPIEERTCVCVCVCAKLQMMSTLMFSDTHIISNSWKLFCICVRVFVMVYACQTK